MRAHLTKLYALSGTDCFASLTPGGLALKTDQDVLGSFTIDSLSVIKTLDKMKQAGSDDWTEVSFPIAIIIFGLEEE